MQVLQSPLHWAAMWGSPSVAAFLIRKGADVTATNQVKIWLLGIKASTPYMCGKHSRTQNVGIIFWKFGIQHVEHVFGKPVDPIIHVRGTELRSTCSLQRVYHVCFVQSISYVKWTNLVCNWM